MQVAMIVLVSSSQLGASREPSDCGQRDQDRETHPSDIETRTNFKSEIGGFSRRVNRYVKSCLASQSQDTVGYPNRASECRE